MKVHSIRRGFANNSSSTHTILRLNPNEPVPKTTESSSFGWEFFTAADKASKEAYAIHTLYANLESLIPIAGISYEQREQLVAAQLEALTGFKGDGYVDHQSVLTLPFTYYRAGIDLRFWEDWRDELLSDDVVILGGNDNTSDEHPLIDHGVPAWNRLSPYGFKRSLLMNALPVDTQRPISTLNVIEHQGKTYRWWVLFDERSGIKSRVTFGDNGIFPVSPSPELVDLKITDYCPFEKDCGFCYQGSTLTGRHADMKDIESIIFDLSEIESVFEIAFGGGEPTLHPMFSEILGITRDHSMVANFTTKNPAIFTNEKLRFAINNYATSFAYSANNEKTIEFLIKNSSVFGRKMTVQMVPEIAGPDLVAKALDNFYEVTLLGYKKTGRGNLFDAPFPNVEKWLMSILKNHEGNVGIDTLLARQLGDDLLKITPSWTFEIHEGARSFYIDAVNNTTARSSYSGPSYPINDSYLFRDKYSWDLIRHTTLASIHGNLDEFDTI